MKYDYRLDADKTRADHTEHRDFNRAVLDAPIYPVMDDDGVWQTLLNAAGRHPRVIIAGVTFLVTTGTLALFSPI